MSHILAGQLSDPWTIWIMGPRRVRALAMASSPSGIVEFIKTGKNILKRASKIMNVYMHGSKTLLPLNTGKGNGKVF